MFNNDNKNNYGSNGVPEYMAYGGVPVGLPNGAIPENATNGAIPQWAVGQQNSQSINSEPNNLQMDNNTINFDDIYYSTIDKNGNILYKGTSYNEGGFSNRKNDLGGKTNYGVTQFSLDEYNSWNSSLKKGNNFPKDVELLTQEQAKQIMDEMYFQRYGINRLTNLSVARNIFDELINQGTSAGYDLAYTLNQYKGTNFKGYSVISPNLATSINLLNSNETSQFNDLLSQKRMSRYFDSVDRNPQKNINNLKGWYNRAKSYYSIPQEFEKLYKNKVDYYILNKYPQFYNGK